VTVSNKLSVCEHIQQVVSRFAQSLHALMILRSHSVQVNNLQLVFKSVILVTVNITVWPTLETSPPQSHLGRAALPPLTAENRLAHCMCYYLCSAHCRSVQSLSLQYAASTPYRWTHDDDIYYTSIASCNKNTPNSHLANIFSKKSNITSYHPTATKVICEELHSHPSHKEWTHPHCVLLTAQCLLQSSPVSQLWVH